MTAVTGDCLFPGGVGNPGHGDDTTLGAERPQLDEWKARRW